MLSRWQSRAFKQERRRGCSWRVSAIRPPLTSMPTGKWRWRKTVERGRDKTKGGKTVDPNTSRNMCFYTQGLFSKSKAAHF